MSTIGRATPNLISTSALIWLLCVGVSIARAWLRVSVLVRAECPSVTLDQRLFPRASVLPVYPIYRVALEVVADCGANGWKKRPFAKLGEQSKALELVFYWIFELGKAKFDACPMQNFIQFGK